MAKRTSLERRERNLRIADGFRKLRRFRLFLVLVLFSVFPIKVVTSVAHASEQVSSGLVGAWLCVGLLGVFRLNYYPCPACQRRFIGKGWRGRNGNPLTTKCKNCGISVREGLNSAP